MDNAEQASRPTTKGIFDTASLLGIPSPQQLCKTNLLSNLVGVSPKKLAKSKAEKDINHSKASEKSKTSNSIPGLVPTGISVISGNQALKPSSKKTSESVNDQIARLFSASEKPLSKRKSKPKQAKPDIAKNGKTSKEKKNKQSKEKKGKKSSSESEGGHLNLDSSGTGTSTGADSISTGSSGESSEDEEEREKQQVQLALLKKQQQELRRKVQELKQASHHEGAHPKTEAQQPKKVPNAKTSPTPGINHSLKPVPSPAHSSPMIPSNTMSPDIKPISACEPIAEEPENLSFPLDLCMKKQEPTFEVTTAVMSSYLSSTPLNTVAKKKLFPTATTANNSLGTHLIKSVAPKKRGRKPKAVHQIPPPMVPPPAHSEKVRARTKRNTIKDIQSLLMPSKMDILSGQYPSPSLLKPGNSAGHSVPKMHHTPNALGAHSDLLSHSHKNFTLDRLLGETNGNLHFPESEAIFPSSSIGNKFFKTKDRQKNSRAPKKFEEKVKEMESPLRHETSSGSDTDPDDENTDTDDSDRTHGDSNTSTPSGHKRKHSYDGDSEDYHNKKKRILPDEREIQIPLEHGWRRETRIRCFSRSGVRGEVTYYTPCGKKLRSYPEVVRYLAKNGITDISRDNFTFSTKMNVGEFLECTASGQDILLNDQEVMARVEEARNQKGRLGVQSRKSLHFEEQEKQRQWEQKQIQHHLDQQAEESRKQKEQQRMLKQQEKFERMEQMRIEREIRNQQMLEEQEMKRQQAVFLREQERERRRQHMILVRALENRKKQEERERKREEILFEKRINREKKMEQRRMELDYLRELKKPVDDMMLKDLMPLPTLNRIPGVKLPGKAFADTLMVFEFLHNFGETLGFDMDSLPTLNSLQMALLNLDEKCEEELLSVVHHLLVCVIDDPGVPHSSESATVLGQNLKDADVTNNNVSEVLRLYFIAQDKRSPMLEWLQSKPFLSLSPSQKAEIMAFVCDELLTSRLLMRQVDSNIENVNVLRKDKWLVEGELRRYRSIQQRRALKAKLSEMESNRNNPNCANMLSNDIPDFSLVLGQQKDTPSQLTNGEPESKEDSEKKKIEEMEKELANESGNESDDTQAPGHISDPEDNMNLFLIQDEDLHLSNDEINKKIDKLSKQLTQCSNKLTKAFYTIRGTTFGMDRYHRRYWVLPKSGGVFVESMESSLKPEEIEKVLDDALEDVSVKKEEDDTEIEDELKNLNKEDEAKEAEKEIKSEGSDKTEIGEDIKAEEEKLVEDPPDVVKEEKLVEAVKKKIEEVNVKVEEPHLEIPSEELIDKDMKENMDCDTEKGDSTDVEGEKTPPESEAEGASKEPEVRKDDKPEKFSTPEMDEITKEDEKMEIVKETGAAPEEVVKDSKAIPEKPLEISKPVEKKASEEVKASPATTKMISDKKMDIADPFPNLKRERDRTKRDDKRHHKEGGEKFPTSDDKKHNVNIFMPNLCDNMDMPKLHTDNNPGPSTDQSWIFNSPLFASILAGNMLFNGPAMMPQQRDVSGTYFNLPKPDSHNPFGPFLGLQPGMLPGDQMFKSLGEKQSNQKPWFSILPRMPCDESLLVAPPQNLRGSSLPMCPPDLRNRHSNPANPSHVASALSNLQMELMNGVVPPGFFLHPFLPPAQFGHAFAPSSSPMPDFNLNFSRQTSTPNSIPTPSATPGPPGCATPNSRDSPSPTFAKRLLAEKLAQEFPAPQPIAAELQRGWWRVTDPAQLQQIMGALHHRGVREKMFQKQLQKHFQFACASCTLGQGKETELEITTQDQEISKSLGGAPEKEVVGLWFRNIALRIDMAVLEQVENLEEKVDGSSMQVKFWKPPPKISTENLSKFIPACEQYVYRTFDEIYDAIKERQMRKNAKKGGSKKKKPQKKDLGPEPEKLEDEVAESAPDLDTSEAKVDLDKSLTEMETSDLAEPIPDDNEKVPLSEEAKGEPETDIIPLPPGKMNPVEEAKNRLLMVEAAIERRYLRHPLGVNPNDLNKSTLSNSGSSTSHPDGTEEDPIPQGLAKWRNAVNNCRSAAQLAMCLNFLESHTAWDKSIMRASCQFCHSGDNEEKLLLCDGCDKGYHTYCFKPVMETIPDGDWYCFECLNKATGDNVCVICGTKGKLVKCEACPKTFHLNCLDPPLAKMPKGKWYCSGCSLNRPPPKKYSKKSSAVKKEEVKEKEVKESPEKTPKKSSEVEKTPKSKSSEKKEKKEKKEKPPPPSPQVNEDFGPCSLILDDMEQHEDAWPFLTPVNTKQFPTYRKVIKKPMDIATMRGRLDTGQYKSRDDFATDARLIFDNCETFNEDDSPVGNAGHSMRAFFETRWNELT